MRLWTEHAWRTSGSDEVSATGFAVNTLTTEDQFAAALVSGWEPGVGDQAADTADRLAQRATSALATGRPPDAVVDDVLAVLPAGEHIAVALLRIGRDGQAALVEINAPPSFMARKGDFILLPVVEEEMAGRLVRRCDFTVQAGDHLALASEDYIRSRRGDRPWNWREIALSVRRLTATGCDAEELAGALVRIANQRVGESANRRIGESANRQGTNAASAIRYSPFAVLAMFVRPMRTATVWSGPPAKRSAERQVLARLLAETDMRIICGDTTAEIAARLLDARLIMEPRPADGWKEVPPVSRMITADGAEPLALITEGVVTMRVALERLVQAKRPRDLAGRRDGASRLAQLLLTADKLHFLVGLAVNPAQTEHGGTPLRKAAVSRLVEALQARGKIVSVEYF